MSEVLYTTEASALAPQKPLCVLSSEGVVEWADNASPAAIMATAQYLDLTMRTALLALWHATHPEAS